MGHVLVLKILKLMIIQDARKKNSCAHKKHVRVHKGERKGYQMVTHRKKDIDQLHMNIYIYIYIFHFHFISMERCPCVFHALLYTYKLAMAH